MTGYPEAPYVQIRQTLQSDRAYESHAHPTLSIGFMKEGKTRVRALDAKEIEIANDFIENEGALSEFIDSIEEL